MVIRMPKNKILAEILPLRIIREVEKWPVLYTRPYVEMPNSHFRNKVWNKVAKALIEDWDSYSPAEKDCKIMDLVKKWRNLRDTFKRQLVLDKKLGEGPHVKRKKYVYFQHMSFLLPHLSNDHEKPQVEKTTRKHGRANKQREAAQATPPAPYRSFDPEHIDEDKTFLMSLLPSLKRMNDDEKLTAKMEILKVIKDVRNHSAAADDRGAFDPTDGDALSDEQLAVKQELFTDDTDFL